MIKNQGKTILIVDPQFKMAQQLSKQLNNVGFNTKISTNKKNTFDSLSESLPDVILLDNFFVNNPKNEILNVLRSEFIFDNIPVIILHNSDTLNPFCEGNDFVIKPFTIKEITTRINNQISSFAKYNILLQKHQQLLNKNNESEKLANTDELTGLFNKRYLLNNLKDQLQFSKDNNQSLTVLMIDIDHFKKINDTYGHIIGDKVLKETSKKISYHLRESDIFVRYGGEEFTIILPNTTIQMAKSIADRIRINISRSLIKIGRKDINITISVGLAKYSPSKKEVLNEEINRLINEADMALYSAKYSGRNKTKVYSFSNLKEPIHLNNNITFMEEKQIDKQLIHLNVNQNNQNLF